jgi:hypothetical protein
MVERFVLLFRDGLINIDTTMNEETASLERVKTNHIIEQYFY